MMTPIMAMKETIPFTDKHLFYVKKGKHSGENMNPNVSPSRGPSDCQLKT